MSPRPTTKKPDTRERILDAARALLVDAGPDGISLREVARSIGLSAPSIYEYFPSKDALVDTLAGDTAARLRRALERAVEERSSEPLLEIGVAYVRFALAHPSEFRLLFLHRDSKRGSLSDAVPVGSPYAVVLRAVSDAALSGRIHAKRTEDVEHIAYGLWALVHGLAVLRLTHLSGMKADFESADRAAIHAYLLGLRPVVSTKK